MSKNCVSFTGPAPAATLKSSGAPVLTMPSNSGSCKFGAPPPALGFGAMPPGLELASSPPMLANNSFCLCEPAASRGCSHCYYCSVDVEVWLCLVVVRAKTLVSEFCALKTDSSVSACESAAPGLSSVASAGAAAVGLAASGVATFCWSPGVAIASTTSVCTMT